MRYERDETVASFIRRIRREYRIVGNKDVLLYERVGISGNRSMPLAHDKVIHSCPKKDFVYYDTGSNLNLGELEQSCVKQNIAIVGSPSHGKSSTINTISKSLGQPAPRAQTYPPGTAGTSSYTRHEFHVIDSSFMLFDVPGSACQIENSINSNMNLRRTLENIFQGKEKPDKEIGESTRLIGRRHRKIHAVVVVQKGKAKINEIVSAALSCARSSGIPVFGIITHVDRMTESELASMKEKLQDDQGIDKGFIFAIANDDSQECQPPRDAQREEYIRSMLNSILAAAKEYKNSHDRSTCILQ